MTNDLIPVEKTPEWFVYPIDFVTAVNDGLLNIGAWQILKGDWLLVRLDGLKKRFPNRRLIPFARRLDSDDIACWEQDYLTEVRVVHDFSAPGWERREEYTSFKAWLRAAQSEESEFEG